VYGGRWLANYASPAGLRDNSLYGVSSNQSIANGSRRTHLRVDDHVFLRPTQSEAVLLQFGDLAIVRGGEIEHYWPVLTPDHEHV
jgi:D-serine deaminase-like pyridoxal phosphate-dependent protein